MQVISRELKGIAIKFKLLDEELFPVLLGDREDEPKTWQDHAEELWEGVKSGGKILADSVTDTVESLIEDPLGTSGQMLYNATIGTVEEVVDTAVWGGKMLFDVGDTREEYDEKISETGGVANYLGQQGALLAGSVVLGRVGVKNRHALKPDSGGDGGGPSRKDQGTGNAALVEDAGSIAQNTENLRAWANDNGWEQQYSAGGVEQWGVRNADGTFSWRLKLKPEASMREGLGTGSNQPRFDARLDDKGMYINPFTGETGGRSVGTHIPLGK
ncbi:hypothetical protein [Paenibacillus sp. DMB20]|uniref:hypothetical protein n=1 Tax=Paenibacillus sp. DMB20 TaxID=1642570 RepID=UPI00069A8964|nr:hypothetical protein [Paenibacillus sp. DMB20]